MTKPLEQRTRKAKFGVYWICLAIVFGAFVVNLLPVPFERHLVDCFELGEDSFKYYTLLKPYDDTPQRLYRFGMFYALLALLILIFCVVFDRFQIV